MNGSYIFGWLEFSEHYAESAGSIVTTDANVSNTRAVGQIATFEMNMDLSSRWYLDLLFRYFYLHTDSCHIDAEQNGTIQVLRAQASNRSFMGAAALGWMF